VLRDDPGFGKGKNPYAGKSLGISVFGSGRLILNGAGEAKSPLDGDGWPILMGGIIQIP